MPDELFKKSPKFGEIIFGTAEVHCANICSLTPDVKFGIYYSLFEWFNPLYLKDKANNFTTR